MKQLAIISLLSICVSLIVLALPEYEDGQYYVFTDSTTASNALHYINTDSGIFPIYSTKDTNRVAVAKWAETPQERVDGKWVFPRIPPARLAAIGFTNAVDLAKITYFVTNFNPTVEMYDTNWFTAPVE